MNAKESIVFMFKGVSNWAPYWQFHFREGGGVLNWAPYWQFHFAEGGGFKLGTILAVSFLGGSGGVPLQVDW